MKFDLLSAVGADETMAHIFAEDRAIGDWLAVEVALTHGLAKAGIIDAPTADRITAACHPGAVDKVALWAETAVVGYPIFPLVKMICAELDDSDAGFVHFGATTQDIMDSALALQMRDAAAHLNALLQELGDGLAVLISAHSSTVMAARTHAQQAVPTTFGAKCAVFLDEITRHRARLADCARQVSIVSLFGAGGTSAALGEHASTVREEVGRRLDLAVTEVPWHVARDRLAALTLSTSMIAATCIRLAREMIDLSRTEVGEVAEADGPYRGASSTMPQKANPISAEMTIGFGVMAQAAGTAMLRGMEAGHERAVGEWQVEWQAIPASLQATAGAMRAAIALVLGLRVYPERMKSNLELDGGRLMAEAYMITMASEVGRDRAHEFLYQAVRRSREDKQPLLTTLEAVMEPAVWAEVGPRLPSATEYLGSCGATCQAALTAWQSWPVGDGKTAHHSERERISP